MCFDNAFAFNNTTIQNKWKEIWDISRSAPYSVSKAAVGKYTLDLAAELKGTGVLVNYPDPGRLRTDLGGPPIL